MRRPAGAGPDCAPMIMALRANVHRGVVFRLEVIRGSQEEVVCGGNWIAQLGRVARILVGIMADSARDTDIRVTLWQRVSIQLAQPRGT